MAEENKVDTGSDAAPSTEGQESSEGSSQTPERLYAGKYKSIEEMEKAYEEAQRKITEEANERKRVAQEAEAWRNVASNIQGNQSRPDPKAEKASLDELKEKLRQDPGSVIEILMERDSWFQNQLAQRERELQERMITLSPEYREVKEDVEELSKLIPGAGKDALLSAAMKLRERYKQTPAAVVASGTVRTVGMAATGNPGGNGRKPDQQNSDLRKVDAAEVNFYRSMGFTDDEIKNAVKGRK